jgi:hypothetical protein
MLPRLTTAKPTQYGGPEFFGIVQFLSKSFQFQVAESFPHTTLYAGLLLFSHVIRNRLV